MDNDTLVQHLIDIKASQARVEAELDSLAGEHGRITVLENAHSRNTWLSGLSLALSPIFVGLHAYARKHGVDI